jgi:hypothetical protein
MNDLSQRLEIGTLLMIETGDYSDISVSDPVRVIRAFCKDEVASAFRAAFVPDDEWQEEPDASDFLPWLVAGGYVENVDNAHRWHVGSWGFEP